MKQLIFKALTMLTVLFLFSCSHEEKSDLENYGLVGKVKSVTTVDYGVYDKFGEGNLQKSNLEYSTVRISSFDSLGNILSDKYLDIESVKREYTTIYNDRQQTIKWLSYNEEDDTKMEYGSNYYYDNKGNLLKEIDLTDNSTTHYKNTYDSDGRLLSQIGGIYKRYWEYDNGELVKSTEFSSDYKWVNYYKNGLVYKDERGSNVYWTYSYDNKKRHNESIMYRNGNINKKIKSIYSETDGDRATHKIEWNADGAVEHDYIYSYFIVGTDTVTTIKYDKGELVQIIFRQKDAQGITEETYETTSKLGRGYQYYYENGNLVSLKDLKTFREYKYSNDTVTVTEDFDRDSYVETKYRRNIIISSVVKDKNGKILFGNTDTDKNKEVYENGKLIKFTDASNGLTSEYYYNESGDVSEIKCSDRTVLTYKYEYDIQGNWIKKIEYKNGKPICIFERCIIYY